MQSTLLLMVNYPHKVCSKPAAIWFLALNSFATSQVTPLVSMSIWGLNETPGVSGSPGLGWNVYMHSERDRQLD